MTALTASTSPALWYSSRATGTVALVLLTAAVAGGMLTATRAGSASLPRFAVADLHRALSLVAMCFVALHVLTAALDTFVSVGWMAIVVPGTSGYAPGWVGLGAVAFDLMVAVALTSLLRARIPARAWRAVHWLTYAALPVAVVHTIGLGTDLRFTWMRLLTGACIATLVGAAGWRLWAGPRRGGLPTALPRPRGAPAAGDGRERQAVR